MVTREIVLDFETTGLDPTVDKIVEIGCVELACFVPTGRVFHAYINPQRSVPAGAFGVHGLSRKFLKSHPVFADVAQEFLAFLSNSPIVAHNGSFDFKFMNAELRRISHPGISESRLIDTMALASDIWGEQFISLDTVCDRLGIDRSHRTAHGALLDAQLLAEVYPHLACPNSLRPTYSEFLRNRPWSRRRKPRNKGVKPFFSPLKDGERPGIESRGLLISAVVTVILLSIFHQLLAS